MKSKLFQEISLVVKPFKGIRVLASVINKKGKMKKILLAVFSLFISLGTALQAQEFQGKAYYESRTTIKMDFGGRNIPEDRKQMILERMKKAGEKTFVLSFNRVESLYKEEQKLEQPGMGGGKGMRFGMMQGGGEDYYKNVKEGTYAVKNDLFGKLFLVKDSLPKLDWKMEAETKKIGNYTAYKATAIKKVKRRNMSAIFNRNQDKKQEVYTEKEVHVVAWYSPEIPVNQGPANYSGLPGLILEVSDDQTSIICSKLVMNPKEKMVIKAPKKGKKVSQAEYDEIASKKMKEMRANGGFRGPGQGRGR